jgi:hypothetical protein
MRNILILAGLAGLAAAVAIYFTGENMDSTDDDYYESDYVTDADIEEYDRRENTGMADPVL